MTTDQELASHTTLEFSVLTSVALTCHAFYLEAQCVRWTGCQFMPAFSPTLVYTYLACLAHSSLVVIFHLSISANPLNSCFLKHVKTGCTIDASLKTECSSVCYSLYENLLMCYGFLCLLPSTVKMNISGQG